jgi:hypothetical protein
MHVLKATLLCGFIEFIMSRHVLKAHRYATLLRCDSASARGALAQIGHLSAPSWKFHFQRGVKQPLNCVTIVLHAYSRPYLPTNVPSVFYSIKTFLVHHLLKVLISLPLSTIPRYQERLISSIPINIKHGGKASQVVRS